MAAEVVVHEDVPIPAAAEVAATAPLNLFGADSPAEVIRRATEHATILKTILQKRGLIVRIGQGEHVKLEGWTTLGSQVGVFAVVTRTEKLDDDGYMAYAEARTLAGQVVGAAEAVCLTNEKNWANRDNYALLSMAQTRACSKALRMPLGFIIELAGYNPTPADEMTFATSDGGLPSSQAPPPSERGTFAATLTPNADGGVPPLLLKADDRAEDGTYPRVCPYCLGQAVEETRRIQRGTPAEREQTFTNCINPRCEGGRPRSGQNAGRWPWSEFGSVEGTFAVGGPVDELVNGGTETVENTTPDFDAQAYLRSALSVCVEWDEGAVKDRLADAKRELAHGRRWSPEVSQMIVGKLLGDYWEQFPHSPEAPF